jgi:hypothetical protein
MINCAATELCGKASKFAVTLIAFELLPRPIFSIMFEQSLYEQAPIDQSASEVQEGDLFQNFELKSWVPSPRLYKILGASALANILALLVVAQTSLLTMKGCDSPLVGSVCQVLDTVYMGSLLLGTQREYADAAYERTELSDMDITYVELPSESSKLQYPEGYFQLANPEQLVANPMTGTEVPFPTNIPTYPGIPMARPIPGNSMLNTPPIYAKPNKNVIKGDLPTGFGDNTAVAETKPGGKKPKAGANTPSNDPIRNPDGSVPGAAGNNSNTNTDPNAAQADKKDEATPDQFGIYINKRPTTDFAAEALQKLENKQVVLDSPFRVTIKGTLGLAKDGKTVILKNAKQVAGPNANAGDPAMLKFAQQAVIAFADAGWFGYLDKLESKTVVVSLEQNDQAVIARLTADQPSEERARAAASGISGLLQLASLKAQGDDQTFLNAAKPGSDGKTFFVNFALPKPVFTEMVQRKLAEQKAIPKETNQPNGTAVVGLKNNLG